MKLLLLVTWYLVTCILFICQVKSFLLNKKTSTTTTTIMSTLKYTNNKNNNDSGYPESETVLFRIYTSAGEFRSIDVKSAHDQLEMTCSSKSRNLYKLVVHGFAETWNMTFRWNWVNEMKREMLESKLRDQICFIAVDWEGLARGGKYMANYWRAIDNMQLAANFMSEYLNANRIDAKRVHCIGFSLGAHMCSIFGKTYYSKFGKKIGRITGLDPAGPFFKSKPTNEKLYHTDAILVDIIHTSEQFGLPDKNGHMDFYPDSGPSNLHACSDMVDRFENLDNVILYEEKTDPHNKQSNHFDEITVTEKQLNQTGGLSGISTNSISTFFGNILGKIKSLVVSKPKRVFIKMHQFFGCSHLMAMRFFIYSINDCDYKSVYCHSQDEYKKNKCPRKSLAAYPRMGFYADQADEFYRKSMGNFFLQTTDKPPYCLKTDGAPKRNVTEFFRYFIDHLKPNSSKTTPNPTTSQRNIR